MNSLDRINLSRKANKTIIISTVKLIKKERRDYFATFDFVDVIQNVVLVLYVIELMMSVAAFKRSFFGHFGYVTDFVTTIVLVVSKLSIGNTIGLSKSNL